MAIQLGETETSSAQSWQYQTKAAIHAGVIAPRAKAMAAIVSNFDCDVGSVVCVRRSPIRVATPVTVGAI